MSDETTILLGLCGFALVIGVLAIFLARYLEGSDKKLRHLAERLGFQYIPKGFIKGLMVTDIATQVIEGSHRGRSIHLQRLYVSWGDDSGGPSHNTRVILGIENPMDYSLSLEPTGFFIRKPKTIPIGEPNFDRQFILRCSPDEIGERIFKSTGLAQRLVEVKPLLFKFEDDQLEFEKGGFEMDGTRESHFRLFDLLCDLAEAFEGVWN